MIKLAFLQAKMNNAMNVIKLLHKKISIACSDINKVSFKALMAGVNSALTEHQVFTYE
ncbi:MAG: hypothetical protein GY694_11980 [Gammaproteobacteria bacterium]|nr:hypothetical protein [Gammaproteobacteria bacterium]